MTSSLQKSIASHDWLTVRRTCDLTGYTDRYIRKIRIELLRHPRPVPGKLRSYSFYHRGSKRPAVRIVAEDVAAMFPSPRELLEKKGRNFVVVKK